jgi:hypothetical protein
MITFKESTANVVELHGLFLSTTPLLPEVFYTAVNSQGWAISSLLSRVWTNPSKYPLETPKEYIIPKSLTSALVLPPDRTVTEIPYTWDSVPLVAIEAFTRLPEPSLAEKADSLALSIRTWLEDGCQSAPKPVIEARKLICSSCEFYSPKGYLGLGKCQKCGCSSLKLYARLSKCLIGKW